MHLAHEGTKLEQNTVGDRNLVFHRNHIFEPAGKTLMAPQELSDTLRARCEANQHWLIPVFRGLCFDWLM